MNALVTEARYATLDDMVSILQAQYARRLDLVVPAGKLRFSDAQLQLKGLDVQVEKDGVTDPNGIYLPTGIFDEKLADYLDVPVRYLRKMRAERPDLYDANANGWLHGRKAKYRRPTADERAAAGIDGVVADAQLELGESWHWDGTPGGPDGSWWKVDRPAVPADSRSFLLRLFRGDRDGLGVARVILSNRYKTLDNLDGLMALLAGLKDGGIDSASLEFERCDLTERRLIVKVNAPEITAMAPELLKGYRNPFHEGGAERANRAVRDTDDLNRWREIAAREGQGFTEEEGGEPIVSAGLMFTNSEVGGGTFKVVPVATVKVCKNGLILHDVEIFKQVHLGGALGEGIQWSNKTQDTNIKLITEQMADVVRTYLSKDFLTEQVEKLEEKAGAKLPKPHEDVKAVAKQLKFSDEATTGILEHFMLAGQLTAAGVMNAITSYSQTLPDGEAALELDNAAVRALDLAAARA